MTVPRPSAQTVFRVTGLGKVYRTGDVEVHALRGVDFTASRGEFIVILGPSGSGKSTFLNIIGGLDRASAGEAWFEDHELTRLDEAGLTRYRRDHVGFIFQFYNLVPSLTARENVQLVTEISRQPMTPQEALALVGLEDRMDHFPGPALRRRAAARGHCPRHRQAPRRAALRRAHGRARFEDRHPRAGSADARECRDRSDHARHHPQCRDRRRSQTGWCGSPMAQSRRNSAMRGASPLRPFPGKAMRALHIKLWRDIIRLWPQALAIAMVMAAGVATLILGAGAHDSLATTSARYYETNRFADVFATATRVPETVATEIAAIGGVASVDTRIQKIALADIADMAEPASVLLVSLPGLSRADAQPSRHAQRPGARPRGRRRGHRQRRLRQGAWTDGRFDDPCSDQWPAARGADHGNGAVARIHLCAGSRRPDAG